MYNNACCDSSTGVMYLSDGSVHGHGFVGSWQCIDNTPACTTIAGQTADCTGADACGAQSGVFTAGCEITIPGAVARAKITNFVLKTRNCVSKSHKNEELCIQNDEFCRRCGTGTAVSARTIPTAN